MVSFPRETIGKTPRMLHTSWVLLQIAHMSGGAGDWSYLKPGPSHPDNEGNLLPIYAQNPVFHRTVAEQRLHTPAVSGGEIWPDRNTGSGSGAYSSHTSTGDGPDNSRVWF